MLVPARRGATRSAMASPATRQPIGTPLQADLNGVSTLAFSPNGVLLASAGADGAVRLWNISLFGMSERSAARSVSAKPKPARPFRRLAVARKAAHSPADSQHPATSVH